MASTSQHRQALDLARSGADRRKAVRHGEPQIIVAVHADDGLVDVSNVLFQISDELRKPRRHGVADRIGNVDRARCCRLALPPATHSGLRKKQAPLTGPGSIPQVSVGPAYHSGGRLRIIDHQINPQMYL